MAPLQLWRWSGDDSTLWLAQILAKPTSRLNSRATLRAQRHFQLADTEALLAAGEQEAAEGFKEDEKYQDEEELQAKSFLELKGGGEAHAVPAEGVTLRARPQKHSSLGPGMLV